MKRQMQAIAAFCVLCLLVPAAGQAGSYATLQMAGEEALLDDRPVEALALSDAILSETPEDFEALILKARALIALDRPKEAAKVAARAFAAAETPADHVLAAGVVARGRHLAGQHARAEWWLRRASNNAVTPEQEREIYDAFQIARTANPLTFQAGFGVAPTNNFNNGSSDGTILFEGLGVFDLPPEDLALSGIEYNGDILMEYRLSRDEKQQTDLGLYLYARTYTPSDSARESVPDISGYDYSLGIVDGYVRHRRLIFPKLGFTGFSAHNGRLFNGGEHYWDYIRLEVSQDVALDDRSALNFQASEERQFGVPGRHEHTRIYTMATGYSRLRDNNDRYSVRLSKKVYNTDAFENSYEDYQLSLDYQFSRKFKGVAVGGSIGIGHTNYDAFYLSLDGRRDDYIFGSARAVWTDVAWYGFSPRADFTFETRNSNVGQYTRDSGALRVGLASMF